MNPSWEADQLSSSLSLPEAGVQVLIAEDNKSDVFLIQEAIQASHLNAKLHVVSDGQKAIDFINRADADDTAPCPTLFLLDLNLPKKSGIEVLQHLRRSTKCAQALVLIVTSSDLERDRSQSSLMGADGYFRKPSGYAAFLKLGEVIKGMLVRPHIV